MEDILGCIVISIMFGEAILNFVAIVTEINIAFFLEFFREITEKKIIFAFIYDMEVS